MTGRRYRRTQQERVGESSRRLIEAAVQLFATNGYDHTTAKDISLRAGYSRAMLAERFGSKKAVLDAIMSDYESRSAGDPGPHPSGFDMVMAPVDSMCHIAMADPEFTRAVFVLGFGAVHDAGELRSRVRQWLSGMRERLSEAIRVGIADGSINRELDPDDTALRIMMAGTGFDYYWIVLPEYIEYPAEVARWRQWVIDTLRPKAVADGAVDPAPPDLDTPC